MSFANIKSKLQKQEGFTIVELLIVIVVIAILAAITIVSYNGITARANASSTATNVETVVKIAEAYNADASKYPASITQFRSGYTDANTTTASGKLTPAINVTRPAPSTTTTGTAPVTVSNITAANTGLTADTGKNTVMVLITGTTTTPTGGVVVSWDFNTGAVQVPAKYTYYGDATASSTFIQIGT